MNEEGFWVVMGSWCSESELSRNYITEVILVDYAQLFLVDLSFIYLFLK